MKSHESARALSACLVAGCACVSSGRAYAEWEIIPDVTLEAEMNDNPALNAIGSTQSQFIDQGSRLLADASVRIRNAKPRGEISFEPRVRGDTYAEEEAQVLESTDFFLRSTGVQRGQTVRLGYSADFAREQIVGIEFLDTAPTDPTADDPSEVATTQPGLNEERTRVGIAPYVEIAMNSRNTVILDGHLIDVDYASDQIAATGRTDFLERSIGGEFRRALGDQRGSFGVHVFATGYEATSNANTTDTRGIDLIYSRTMSELWSWNASIGTQRSDFAVNTGGRRVRGTDETPTYAFGVTKRGERSTMHSELVRRMSPDSMGFVAPRDEIRVGWTRRMSDRVSGRLGLRGINAEGVPTVVGSNRQYGRIELGLDWALRPTWSFVASYAYAKSSSEVTIGDAADSNAFTLGVRYHGRERPNTLTQ